MGVVAGGAEGRSQGKLSFRFCIFKLEKFVFLIVKL